MAEWSDDCARSESEVFVWLKSLSPSLKLERLSYQFETRGFRSRRSLAYVKSEDLDAFFPSPDKLLLAERRLLEAELEIIRKGTVPRSNFLEPKRLIMTLTTVQTVADNFTERQQSSAHDHGRWMANSSSSEHSTTALSPLDRSGV